MISRNSLTLVAFLASVYVCSGRQTKPNLVLILVDDQDTTLNSTHPYYMPALNKHLIEQGVHFPNYFTNTPICCPSRATILTGRHTHNTNFTDITPPYGGYTIWRQRGLDLQGYLPSWLQEQGYGTYYVGKLFVEYAIYNYHPPPANWTDIDALLLPFVFEYNLPVFSRNGAAPVAYPGQYSTDVVADKALAQIKTAAAAVKADGKPFYLQIAPIACHDNVHYDSGSGGAAVATPPYPAARHAKLYPGVTLPRGANFNESDVSDKPAWIKTLPAFVSSNVTFMDEYYRQRLRTLRAADELVDKVVQQLTAEGLLDDTYIIYTGDNGYHIGAHRQGSGKETPYEEDIHVPFYIRGPGLKQGVVNSNIGSHVDLASTLVALAGGKNPAIADGQTLPLHLSAEQGAKFVQPKERYQSLGTEYWGFHIDQITDHMLPNFTWKSIRADFGKAGVFKYTVWCTKEHELYDLTHDPAELVNLANNTKKSEFHSPELLSRIMTRMDALISAFYYCQGVEECVNPLRRVLPNVTSLEGALSPALDAYFAAVPRFRFERCSQAVLLENEVGGFDAQLPAKQPRPIPTEAIKAYGTPAFDATKLFSTVTDVQSASNASVAISDIYQGVSKVGGDKLMKQLIGMFANITWHNPLIPVAVGAPPQGQAAAVSLARSGATQKATASKVIPVATSKAFGGPSASLTGRKLLLDQGGAGDCGGHGRRLADASAVTHLAPVESSAVALPADLLGLQAVQLAHAFVNKRYSMGGFA